MTYSQLRAFHHVAMLGGFSLAADALGLTQPAISDQVRKLERDNDVLLFSRVRKKVVLTPEGEKLFAKTRSYFGIEDQIGALLSKSANRIEDELRIMVDSASHISGAVQRFREMFTHVRIVLTTGNSEEIVHKLRAFKADIGVVGSCDIDKDFQAFPLSVSRLVAFARRDLFSSQKQAITLAELGRLPLVVREPGSRTRQQFEDHARERGVTFDPAIVAEGRETVREIVAASDAVGIVSEAEMGDDQRIRVLQLDDIELEMREMVVHLRQRRDVRVIREFMRICKGQAALGSENGLCTSLSEIGGP